MSEETTPVAPAPKRKRGRPRKHPMAQTAATVTDTPATPVETPRPTKKATDVDFSAFTSDGDLVDVWERRMLNPNQKLTKPIRIKTPGMHLRWINLTNNGRYQRARYEEGWIPVHRDELVDEKEIYGATYSTEGWVCKGEKQSEMLVKMPEAVWKKIRQRQYAAVEKSNRQIKEHMQAAGAKHFSDKYNSNTGHEMAEQFDAPRGRTGAFTGEIKFGSEQVVPDAEELATATSALE